MNAGTVELPADPRRQPGLHGALRSEVRRGAGQGRRCARISVCYQDETAALLPLAHSGGALPRERGATFAADDGTVSIIQPLIAPLYGGTSVHEVVSALSDAGARSGYDLVRAFWSGAGRGADTAGSRTACTRRPVRSAGRLLAGRFAGHRAAASAVRSRLAALASRRRDAEHRVRAEDRDRAGRRDRGAAPARRAGQGLEVVFRPDPSVYDGRFANNAWLQELPKSLTKLTWDNAALRRPGTAERLNLVSGDVVEVKQGRARFAFRSGSRPGTPPTR